MEEERTKLQSDKEIMWKMEQDKLREFENKIQRKAEHKKVLDEQLEQVRQTENLKRINKMSNLEEEMKYKEKFQKIMDNKEQERVDIKLNVQEKARIRDIREKNHVNARSLQDLIDMETDNRYRKEKAQIDRR